MRVGAPGRIRRVAAAVLSVPLVERKKMGRSSGQTGCHQHRFGIGGEMDEGAPLECEDRVARVAVLLVLPARVLHGLAGQRVLQFDRGDRDTVEAQRHVEGFPRP